LTQAAGRCNREGNRENGEVVYFQTPDPPPPGMLRQRADAGNEIINNFPDPMDSVAIDAYFKLHYWRQKDLWDKYNVIHESTVPNNPSSMQFQFATMASRYRFIREEGSALLIPWSDEGEYFRDLFQGYRPPTREEWRLMQRYCIQVRDHELKELQKQRAVDLCYERWVLIEDGNYDAVLGLVDKTKRSYEDFIC